MNAVPALLKTRLVNLYLFLFCAASLGTAYYMQYAMELEPCALCIMQRVFFFATGLVALAAAIHGPAALGTKIYGAVTTLTAAGGGGFALRQIYLQHLPADQIPACLPSVSTMLENNFPMKKVMHVLFYGDGNCAEITWRDPLFSFFTIPDLSLIAFVMLAAASVWLIVRK